MVAAENTPDNQVSAGERYASVYEINMTRCIFCGYCEVACPFDAITMGNDYELADYSALRPHLHQGDAAGRPGGAHAAAPRGGVVLFEQILFFLFAVLAIGGAVAVVLITNPFYSVLSLVIHLVALARSSSCCARSSSRSPRWSSTPAP